jgi:hypothetical protein
MTTDRASLSALHDSLTVDAWRQTVGFSSEMHECNVALERAADDTERAHHLEEWLKKYQPCIFGKLAAERGLVSYCFLSESILSSRDSAIGEHIQIARRAWKDVAKDGRKSAFVLVATSARLVSAAPDSVLQRFALRLCELYLSTEILPDAVYHDRLRLWDLSFLSQRRWRAGVNVFASAGDKRWWNDHRIPGGLAFSVNSVGHLVASEARRVAIREAAANSQASRRAAEIVGAEAGLAVLRATTVGSLEHALKYAMHTIRNASESRLGAETWSKATSLMRADPGSTCPYPLVAGDKRLAECNISTYAGWYHTDISIPSEYFVLSQSRPEGTLPFALDLTYLHAGRGSDFRSMASGDVVLGKKNTR